MSFDTGPINLHEGDEGAPLGEDGAVHGLFGLSYAQYLVLNRTLMQSMPLEWQERFVECVDELFHHFTDAPVPEYYVQVLARALERVSLATCPDCEGDGYLDIPDHETGGVLGPCPCDLCDSTGCVEDERWETVEEVGTITDPIPPYERGRTRVDREGRRR